MRGMHAARGVASVSFESLYRGRGGLSRSCLCSTGSQIWRAHIADRDFGTTSTPSWAEGDFRNMHWVEKRENRSNVSDESERPNGRSEYFTSRSRQDFQERFRPENETQRPLIHEIRGLGRRGQWEEALRLYFTVEDPEIALRIAALEACTRCFQLKEALSIFEAMPTKPLRAYTSLIHGLGRMRRADEVDALFERLQKEESIVPDAVVYTAIITAYGMVHRTEDAIRKLREMETAGFVLGEIEYAAAISACGKAGKREQAQSLLAEMEARQLVVQKPHYTSVIAACARNKEEAEGRKVLAEMRGRSVLPDVVTYTSLLGCIDGKTGGSVAFERAEELAAEMRQAGIKHNSFSYAALLNVALEAGQRESFNRLLKQMEAERIPHSHAIRMLLRQFQAEQGSSQVAQSALAPAPAPATTPLPQGWREAVDPASGRSYYYTAANPAGTTTWERPTIADVV
eukprot:TRINITY_DN4395_c0_g1_i1.p1 TRINITY_DN4395_c0_g1~~TRINITY_DN4395_c0_g1_i1.p1  ORF type:complete len:458 (-),score=67.38 TRINITY_DN4395_c0_g1_i1:471-1844(-)